MYSIEYFNVHVCESQTKDAINKWCYAKGLP